MAGSENKGGVPPIQEARREAVRRIELAKQIKVQCSPKPSTQTNTSKGAR